MKNIKSIIFGLAIASMVLSTASCNLLDLSPIDYYGSEGYWKTEAQVKAYVDGLHQNLRDASWTHTMTFGELRGGQFVNGNSGDGNSTSDGNIVSQNFTDVYTGVSNFGNYYGRIINCNLLIARVEAMDKSIMSDDARNYYLATAYGLRAFYYFDLYRIYGGVPLRLDVAVIDGEIDPAKLYMKRSSADEVLEQVKTDVEKSISLFGSQSNFKYTKHYWSKAASEMLAAQVYLWSGKTQNNDGDIAKAKTYCNNVLGGYGLSLQKDFGKIFDYKNKINSEIIMAVKFDFTEATNSNANFIYQNTNGQTQNAAVKADGTPFGSDPLGLNVTCIQRYQYVNAMFAKYDAADSRQLATFYPAYKKEAPTEIYNTFVVKNMGHMDAASGLWKFDGDYVIYRLAEVYAMLAEIANYEGDNAGVVANINELRKRAYGANWNETTFGYKAGSFTQNEYAILLEKDREFLQEGHRWFDLIRMTETKGGKKLVHCADANPSAAAPILPEADAYKILWPLDQTLLGSDPELKQTPGYPNA